MALVPGGHRAAAGEVVSVPDLTWGQIINLFDRYATAWECADYSGAPWPGDPDGGELRIAMALRSLAALAARLGPDAAISTERLRAHLSPLLIDDIPTPAATTKER
jgi:hypothetical protein